MTPEQDDLMNVNKTAVLILAIVIVLAVVVAGVYVSMNPSPANSSTAPTTVISTVAPTTITAAPTTMPTTTIPPSNSTTASASPGVLNKTGFQSALQANGTYVAASSLTQMQVNGKSVTFNQTTAQFNFSMYGKTKVSETFTYPAANYANYSPNSWYGSAVSSFSTNASKNSAFQTAQSNGAVSGMTYTLFNQQNGAAGNLRLYLFGYKGMASIAMNLTGFATSVTPASQNSLIAAIAQAA